MYSISRKELLLIDPNTAYQLDASIMRYQCLYNDYWIDVDIVYDGIVVLYATNGIIRSDGVLAPLYVANRITDLVMGREIY